jgi:hypothetical protein
VRGDSDVTESSSSEQASVVFMGRESFRMQAVGAPGLGDMAIPNRASDIPTERIFRVKGDEAFLALPLPAAAAVQPWRSASKGALIGLGGVMFALGMLVTSPAAHSWLRVGRRPVQVVAAPAAAPVTVAPVAVAPVTAPVAPPVTAPVALPVTPPIVVAGAAPEPAVAPAPAGRRAVASKLARAPRARIVRPTGVKHPAEAATDGPLPEPAAPEVSRAPAKKWVDPFAD